MKAGPGSGSAWWSVPGALGSAVRAPSCGFGGVSERVHFWTVGVGVRGGSAGALHTCCHLAPGTGLWGSRWGPGGCRASGALASPQAPGCRRRRHSGWGPASLGEALASPQPLAAGSACPTAQQQEPATGRGRWRRAGPCLVRQLRGRPTWGKWEGGCAPGRQPESDFCPQDLCMLFLLDRSGGRLPAPPSPRSCLVCSDPTRAQLEFGVLCRFGRSAGTFVGGEGRFLPGPRFWGEVVK